MTANATNPVAVAILACIAVAFGATEWKASFSDVARQAGLTGKNTYGGQLRKGYILETTGNGVASFDYAGYGAEDIFFANGIILQAKPGGGGRPQLYGNDGKGHFTDVAATAGLTASGWAQGVCVGDYDNDGHPDFLVTYCGHNQLFRNRGN